MEAIMNIEYRKGGNDIAAAVRYMDQEMFKVNPLVQNSVISSYRVAKPHACFVRITKIS